MVFGAESNGNFAYPLAQVESTASEHLLPLIYASVNDLDFAALRICEMLKHASRVNAVSPMFDVSF